MNKRPITVKELRDLLNALSSEHDGKPVCCWINSQSPTEPIYTGCDRIPIIHMDVMENWNTIDLNCEGPTQPLFETRWYDNLKEHAPMYVVQQINQALLMLDDEPQHSFKTLERVFLLRLKAILLELVTIEKENGTTMTNEDVVKYVDRKLKEG